MATTSASTRSHPRPGTPNSSPPSIVFSGRPERIGERRLIRFPPEASRQLPSRGQVAARATVNGIPFDTVIEPDGRRGHWLRLDTTPARALTNDETTLSVEVEPSKAWPEPDVPDDLQGALDEARDIEVVWSDITPMARWEWVRWVGATKNPDTRERRIDVTVSKLRSGKRRPCCFDLASCTDPVVAKSGKLPDPSS